MAASSARGGAGDGDLLRAAEQVWGALDKMAAASPEEYQRFIKEQLKEGEEVMGAPQPVFCIRVPLKGAGKGANALYLNVCEWKRMPKPKTDEDPVPVKGGTVRHLLHTNSKRKTQDLVYDVAFNPDVLSECLRDPELEEMLIGLCLDYVENETNLKIADRKHCRKVEEKYRGEFGDIRASIDEHLRDFLTPESRMDIGESILAKLRDMDTTKGDKGGPLPELKLFPEKSTTSADIRTREGDSPADSAVSGPRPPSPTRKLIQELGSAVAVEGGSREVVGVVPQYSVAVIEGGRGREVSAKVILPGVRGVKEVELEVSESDLDLIVEGKYHLTLRFPEPVQDELTRATFSTKLSTLTVTIPCIKPA